MLGRARHSIGFGVPMVLALAASLLSGCSASSSVKAATPTATLFPTATATPALTAPAVCTNDGGAALSATKGYLPPPYGISRSEAERLPDGLAQKPQVLTDALNAGQLSLDDGTLTMFDFSQPPAGQVGYICGVTLRIESFQPLSGSVANVTVSCLDQQYYVPGGWTPSTACPASALPAGGASAKFTSAAVGATATASVTTPTLAATDPVRPGQEPSWFDSQAAPGASRSSTLMVVGIKVPQAGTYTFSVRFWQDRSGPSVTAPDIMETFALGQVQREWGGEQCKAADMQAQLPPPTDPPTKVICPGPYPPQR